MNGEALPDLNGGEFLRGDTTSGGTGGSDTMAHTHSIPNAFNGQAGGDLNLNDQTTGGASNTENRPPYYNVVWIMRIK